MIRKTNLLFLLILTIIVLIFNFIVTEVRAAEQPEKEIVLGERLTLKQEKSSVSIPPCVSYLNEEVINEEKHTEEEELLAIITKVIYVEARGECYEGQVAVGASFVNRLESEQFPDTVEDVLEAYAEIDWVTEEMLEKYPQCREAAIEALDGVDPLEEILSGPTFFFYCPELADPEVVALLSTLEDTYRLGSHVFFTEWYE